MDLGKRRNRKCGFLDKLLPGDMVMADRSFTIHGGDALMHTQLVIPAFTTLLTLKRQEGLHVSEFVLSE